MQRILAVLAVLAVLLFGTVAHVAGPLRAEPVQAEPVQAEPVPGEPVPGKSVPGKPVPGEPVEGEFGGDCVMGLALGKDIRTDCSVHTTFKGRTYCFGNETARMLFLKRPEDFLLKAHIDYSSRDAPDE